MGKAVSFLEPPHSRGASYKKGGAFSDAALFRSFPENQCVPQLPEEQEPPQLLPPVLAKGI